MKTNKAFIYNPFIDNDSSFGDMINTITKCNSTSIIRDSTSDKSRQIIENLFFTESDIELNILYKLIERNLDKKVNYTLDIHIDGDNILYTVKFYLDDIILLTEFT